MKRVPHFGFNHGAHGARHGEILTEVSLSEQMTKDTGVLEKLRGALIVSCQAEGDDPFNTPERVALFAKAAVMGGARGIRSEGLEKIREIKTVVNVPVIGLIKSRFDDGFVRITGAMDEVVALLEAGSDIVAIDGTFRLREGLTGPEFIEKVKQQTDAIVLADIAEEEEAQACEAAGADCISTALNGYTPATCKITEVDFDLLRRLSCRLGIPVLAEGRLNTPELAAKAMENGAFAVVVGTAITRPRVSTSWFVEAIKQ